MCTNRHIFILIYGNNDADENNNDNDNRCMCVWYTNSLFFRMVTTIGTKMRELTPAHIYTNVYINDNSSNDNVSCFCVCIFLLPAFTI